MAEITSKKILLVDDDRFMLQLIYKALTREGFICYQAHSVKKAIELLEKITPDIILSDYQMPDMNGFEFREKVMNDNRWKNVPFVFLTSFTNEEVVLQGLDMQVLDYIVKDTPISIVISKLNNIIYNVGKQHEKSIQELRSVAEALNLRSVPVESPQVEGYLIDFWHRSYQNYPGGDFIDFIEIDNEYTFIVLGDVMGKKWGAWFFSFNFLSYIRSAVRLCVFERDFSTASILQKINNVIYMDPVLSDVLSTLSLVMIEHKTGKVLYSGAGDLPLIFYQADVNEYKQINSGGLLLGVLKEGQYDEKELNLKSGDQLILISDGMIDYQGDDGMKTDYQFFFDSISGLIGQLDTVEKIINETFLKENSKEQIDDCSLIFIQKN
ncbi:SpoIIE family protein phosphatase [Rubrolithibacter danxiaensis]|uniref:SpoIIE family protein phosphatase n=1 Tax=Rubrolithibacter danxiaensis TaxID=3390805 RepID=UPI003BF8348F